MKQEIKMKKKESYQYLEEGSWMMLNELLSEGHILKMKSMVEKDIKDNGRLLNSIT